MIEITDKNYETTVQNSDVVLLDFYADWCGPCKAMTPVLEKVELIARERGQKLIVGKVDTGVEVNLASKFNISALPTLVFVKNGEEVHRHVGMASSSELSGAVDGFFEDKFETRNNDN